MKKKKIEVIDLFCGIGGLSHGLKNEGFDVLAGIDSDLSCKFGYEYNNNSKFIGDDIRNIKGKDLKNIYSKDSFKILVGCAPCQPFSMLNTKKNEYLNYDKAIERSPIDKFAKLIEEVQPDIISMENVRGLANKDKYPAFKQFLETLEKNNYKYSYKIIDSKKYGIPQNRIRLVLLASKFGDIDLIPYTHENKFITVRDVISNLEKISAGEVSSKDKYHVSRKLNDLNLKRIKSIPKNGGNLLGGDKSLIAECHKKDSGKSYLKNIYARMKWDEPAPTMTTQCIGIGNGRFGHPEQDRGISLREAAIFQTFPDNYKFVENENEISTTKVARYIGNAVPVKLGEIIGISIKKHLEKYYK